MKYAAILLLFFIALVVVTLVVRKDPDKRCWAPGDSDEWKQYCLASSASWKKIP
jgi:hypothetical protein